MPNHQSNIEGGTEADQHDWREQEAKRSFVNRILFVHHRHLHSYCSGSDNSSCLWPRFFFEHTRGDSKMPPLRPPEHLSREVHRPLHVLSSRSRLSPESSAVSLARPFPTFQDRVKCSPQPRPQWPSSLIGWAISQQYPERQEWPDRNELFVHEVFLRERQAFDEGPSLHL